jgi:hypothetical protein
VQSSSRKVHFIIGNRDGNVGTHLPIWGASTVPVDWFTLCAKGDEWPNDESIWKYYFARRKADDELSLAFAKLPPERRAELLAAPPYEYESKPQGIDPDVEDDEEPT